MVIFLAQMVRLRKLGVLALLLWAALTAEASALPASVLVKPAAGADSAAIAARHGLRVDREFEFIGWVELVLPAGDPDVAGTASALKGDPDVSAVDAVREGEVLEPAGQPRDEFWSEKLATSEDATWHLKRTFFPAAWDRATGDGALIGIIDSEFDQAHRELATKIRQPYNTETRSGTQMGPEKTTQLHGTHVAGIAAAVPDNFLGGTGAGYNANIVPVRVPTEVDIDGSRPIDSRFVANLLSALEYLSGTGVSVINMSLGTTSAHPPLEAALAALRAKGVTLVAAAGNFQDQPGLDNARVYPASYPGVIAVANTTSSPTNEISPSSSQGSWVDLSAPGTNILSTWASIQPRTLRGGWNFHTQSGTSMSAPLVSGLVALMKSVRPDLTPDEVEVLMKSTAMDLGGPGQDPIYGAGLIDADRAVRAALEYVRPASAPPVPVPAPAPIADPAPPPTLQKFGTQLKLRKKGKARRRVYTGRITSSGRGCKSFRRVILRRVGSKRRVATVLSRGDGTFRFRARRRPAKKVVVAVTERKSGLVFCRTAKSRSIRG